MAKRQKVVQRLIEIESQSPSSAIVEKIILALKPDRDITAGEFLKRAFQFPQIDKIVVQKYSVGTWNFAEDLGNLGPSQDTANIETYLKEKYGAWRFRLLAVVQGEVVTQHVLNLDGWQENEGRAAASAQSNRSGGPMLGAGAKPAGPGATRELLAMAQERLEIENTTALLAGLNQKKVESSNDVTMAPMRMMAEMMTATMTMMREAMTTMRGGMTPPQEDRFLAYLQSEIQFLREQSLKPAASRDPDALSRTITTIDDLLQKTLNTSLAEMLSGASKTEATGWTATIQGIIEGVRPYLGEIMGAIRTAVPSGPRAIAPANVIPINRNRVDPNATQPEGGEAEMKANPEIVELLNLLIESLKKKEYETVDAILTNPPMRGQFNLNPNTPGSVYAVMFKVVDPRFGAMGTEIQGYLEHVKEEIAKAEAEAENEPE